jgi:hypothetical protein
MADKRDQGSERTDQDQDWEIIILPSGEVMLPREEGLVPLAEALGDDVAAAALMSASDTEFLVGTRMCG